MMTVMPSFSKAQPGAVPQSLWNTVQPRGRSACWRLFSVKGALPFLEANQARRKVSSSASR